MTRYLTFTIYELVKDVIISELVERTLEVDITKLTKEELEEQIQDALDEFEFDFDFVDYTAESYLFAWRHEASLKLRDLQAEFPDKLFKIVEETSFVKFNDTFYVLEELDKENDKKAITVLLQKDKDNLNSLENKYDS